MDFDQIKEAAAGRCADVIASLTPLTAEVLVKGRQDHPCPMCDGKTVIWPDDRDGGANQHGSIACRNCTDNRPTGDIIATVKTFGGFDRMGDAAKAIVKHLGIKLDKGQRQLLTEEELIEVICNAKKIPRTPRDGLKEFRPALATRGRIRDQVLRIKTYSDTGELYSYFDLMPNHKGMCKPGKGNLGCFFPGRLPQAGENWIMVEGVKDAAALISIGYNAAGIPQASMAGKFARLFRDVNVVIVHDLDKPGVDGASKSAARLANIATSVRVARIPGDIVKTGGDDVRDVLARDGGEQQIRDAIIDAAEYNLGDTPDSRPSVEINLEERRIIHTVTGHLAGLGWTTPWVDQPERAKVYQRSGQLVRVITYEREYKVGKLVIAKGTSAICPLPVSLIGPWVLECCRLYRVVMRNFGPEEVDVRCPQWLRDALFNLGEYPGIRNIEAVITAPTLRPDGSSLQEPGYDPDTRLLYHPQMEFEAVPESPTFADAQEAYNNLLDIIQDFPIADDNGRASWIAMLLSMVGRAAVPGKVPLFVINGNAPGVGKSMLVDVATIIAFGHEASRQSYSPDDAETRKLITSVVWQALPSVLLDNVDGYFGNKSLDAMLTSSSWQDRLLTTNKLIDEPMRAVWSVTGNNIELGATVARRTILIDLISDTERPEDRTVFTYPRLLHHIGQNRASLIRDALTVLRAYFLADCPRTGDEHFGSFEEWNDVIRGAVCWASAGHDPYQCRGTVTEHDASGNDAARWITGLLELDPTQDGVTTRQIADAVNEAILPAGDPYPTLRDVVTETAAKNGKPDSSKIGYRLRSFRNRVVGDYRLCREGRRWVITPRAHATHKTHGSLRAQHRDVCVSQQRCDTHTDQIQSGTELCVPCVPCARRSCECGKDMVATPAEPGWVNWDCPSCGAVKPSRTDAESAT